MSPYGLVLLSDDLRAEEDETLLFFIDLDQLLPLTYLLLAADNYFSSTSLYAMFMNGYF